MANSVQKVRGLPICSLGFVQVATPGTVVPLSVNIDANNTNSPSTATGPVSSFPGPGQEYTPAFRGFHLQGFQPYTGNNNSAPRWQPNAGNVYLLMAAAGGSGNRSDAGCVLGIITPGADFWWPPEGAALQMFSPYFLYLDSDSANDGALTVAFGGGNP
jgi:hypothetical protein